MTSSLDFTAPEEARELIEDHLAFFDYCEHEGIPYCLVGGLGVAIHALSAGATRIRVTEDADILVPHDYTNQNFADDYLVVYATSPEKAKVVYDFMFGNGSYESLSKEDQKYLNMTFVGPSESQTGVSTPDFDVCRLLNNLTIDTIESQRLTVGDHTVTVATPRQLLWMKEQTVGLLHNDINSGERPQDFADISLLRELLATDEPDVAKENVSILKALLTVIRGIGR